MYAILDEIRDLMQSNINTSNTAESGTTATNIKVTAHGLVTGDAIINVTRSNAERIVTVVDANNFTVESVTGQTTGDSITFKKFKKYYCGKINEKKTIPHNHLPIFMIYPSETNLHDRKETQKDRYARNLVIDILTSSFAKVTSAEDNGDMQAQKQIWDLMEELDVNRIPKANTVLGVLRRNIRLTYGLFNDEASNKYDEYQIEDKLYFRGRITFSVTTVNARS